MGILKKRAAAAMMLAVMLTAVFSGCGGDGGEDTDTTPVTTTTSDPATTTTTKVDSTFTRRTDSTTPESDASSSGGGGGVPEGINYLTGLPLAEGDSGDRRPTVVVINNIKASLPQSGISQADMIFEVEAESGITRLLAVFYDPSSVGRLGSVRSTRTAFVNIAMGLDAMMVHAGGSPQAYDDIKNRSTLNADGIYDTTTFYRDQNRVSTKGLEHSMFTTGARIAAKWERLKTAGTRTTLLDTHTSLFSFYAEDTTPLGGTAANRADLTYNASHKPYFQYSSASGTYLRYQYGDKHVDEVSKEQLSFKNVILLSVTSSVIPGDYAYRRKFDDVGSGTGVYLTNGVQIPIKWSKASATAPLILTAENGDPLKINPGKTYIGYVNGEKNFEVK